MGAPRPPKQKKGAGDGALCVYLRTSHLATVWSARTCRQGVAVDDDPEELLLAATTAPLLAWLDPGLSVPLPPQP